MPDPGKYLLPAARGLPFADLGDGAAWGRWADDYSAQPCVSLGDETLTYCDLDCRSNAAAHLLLALGVAKGDRVAIMAPNCTLLPALYIACHKIGALAAPLAFLMDLQQLAGQLAAVQPSVVVFHCSVADTILPTAQVLGLPMPLLQFGHVKGSVPDGTAQDWDMLVAQQSSGPPPPVLADANDGAFVLTASDAAGMPRALLLTHRNLLLFDDPSEVQMVTGDTVLFSFGLYTPEAVIFAMLAFRLGAHLCLSRGGAGAEIVEEVARRGVTWAYLPPGAWALVLEAADRQPLVKEQCASVRVVYYGARMVHPKILRGVMDLMPQAELIRGGQFGAKMRQLQSLYAVERFRGPAFLHSVPRHCSYEPPNQSLPHIYSQQLALHGARDPLALDADQYRPRGADQKGWAAEDRGPPTTFPRLSTHYQFVQ